MQQKSNYWSKKMKKKAVQIFTEFQFGLKIRKLEKIKNDV